MTKQQINQRPSIQGTRPPAHAGLRHVALFVEQWDNCLAFYVDLLGMQVEWHPDADNIYLTSGNDNLALHRATQVLAKPTTAGSGNSRLDHIGFILNEIDQVDAWHNFLLENQVTVLQAPKTHRDGARSLYCADPDGNTVQLIYHPPLAPQLG